jgi:hypothetical protein
MSLTLKQIREEVRAGLGGREDLEPRIDKAINLAQSKINRAHKFDELYSSTDLTTTADVATLDISSITNLDQIYSVVLIDGTNSRRIVKVSNRNWDKSIAELQTVTTDRPTLYSRWGKGLIEFLPTPNAVYTIRIKYSKFPTELTDDNTQTDYIDKEELIIEYALHYLNKMLGNKVDAEMYFRNYRHLLKEAIEDDVTDPDGVIQPGMHITSSEPWNNPFVKRI